MQFRKNGGPINNKGKKFHCLCRYVVSYYYLLPYMEIRRVTTFCNKAPSSRYLYSHLGFGLSFYKSMKMSRYCNSPRSKQQKKHHFRKVNRSFTVIVFLCLYAAYNFLGKVSEDRYDYSLSCLNFRVKTNVLVAGIFFDT